MAAEFSGSLRGAHVKGEYLDAAGKTFRHDYTQTPATPSHCPPGLCDNCHTLSWFLSDTQPWQVASDQHRSTLCLE